MNKKYCDGLDCAMCGESEHCIYREANELQKKVDVLEQECEQLKKQLQADKVVIISTGKMDYQFLQEYDKLKQTITEIKEIAEENIRIADLEGLNGVYRRGLANQILQKISKF